MESISSNLLSLPPSGTPIFLLYPNLQFFSVGEMGNFPPPPGDLSLRLCRSLPLLFQFPHTFFPTYRTHCVQSYTSAAAARSFHISVKASIRQKRSLQDHHSLFPPTTGPTKNTSLFEGDFAQAAMLNVSEGAPENLCYSFTATLPTYL